MNNCSICCEDFTSQKRKKVECNYCNYIACKDCFQKYIITDPTIYPKCMNCNSEFSFDFVRHNTSSSFFNKSYMNKRVQDALSREKSLLPSSQVYVERELEKRNIIKEINEKQEMQELYLRYARQISYERRILENTLRNEYSNITNGVGNTRRVFTLPCPVENCKGFVSQQYKCGTCSTKICPDCREPKLDNTHVCNPDHVETVKLLKSDTKQCPSCSASIYKIEGCDQMYCTSCNTPFSWSSGKIITGRIHNPHYYEYLRNRENGNPIRREQGDNPCNVPSIHSIRKIMQIFYSKSSTNSSPKEISFPIITEAYRLPIHINAILLPQFTDNDETDNQHAILNRVSYLLNELPEQKWISTIKSQLKRTDFNKEIHDLLLMITEIINDNFRKAFSNEIVDLSVNNIIENVNDFFNELLEIKNYVNSQFRQIMLKYNLRTFVITEYWNIKPSNSKTEPRKCTCDHSHSSKFPPNLERLPRLRFNICQC